MKRVRSISSLLIALTLSCMLLSPTVAYAAPAADVGPYVISDGSTASYSTDMNALYCSSRTTITGMTANSDDYAKNVTGAPGYQPRLDVTGDNVIINDCSSVDMFVSGKLVSITGLVKHFTVKVLSDASIVFSGSTDSTLGIQLGKDATLTLMPGASVGGFVGPYYEGDSFTLDLSNLQPGNPVEIADTLRITDGSTIILPSKTSKLSDLVNAQEGIIVDKDAICEVYVGSELIGYLNSDGSVYTFERPSTWVPNNTYILKSAKPLVLSCNYPFDSTIPTQRFIDEQEVSSDVIALSKGSTLATINPDFLETLSVGQHTIKLVFGNTGYSAESTFYVSVQQVVNPGTGDTTGIPATHDTALPMVVLALVALAGAGLSSVGRRLPY